MTFALTAKQLEAVEVCAGEATNVMLEGGSGSGKTAVHCRNIIVRALKAPGSRHAIFRFRFNHVVDSVGRETMPDILRLAFPGLEVKLDKQNWIYTLPNLSEIYLGGLDDKERTEKILGKGLVTALLNECSQIPWNARQMVVTRMRQKVRDTAFDKDLKVRLFYDQNPTNKGHWTYKLFHKKMDPDTGQLLLNPFDYAYFKMNPQDNEANLSADYLKNLAGMSPRYRKRFWEGEAADENPFGLFNDANIDSNRVLDGVTPEFIRIVVAVDPSGSGDTDNSDNDAIGIIVAGLGTDGNAYILDDFTKQCGPATWGAIAVNAYRNRFASVIVYESNFGGEMVRSNLIAAASKLGIPQPPIKKVVASRGKVVRAEPIAALYEQNRVRHVGYFRDLEDELAGFNANGYTGQKSPNRADALIWAITELFPGIVKEIEPPAKRESFSAYTAQLGFV